MKRRVPQISRAELNARTQHQMAVIAQAVADGGTVRDASRSLGLEKTRGVNLWARIVREMGEQAC